MHVPYARLRRNVRLVSDGPRFLDADAGHAQITTMLTSLAVVLESGTALRVGTRKVEPLSLKLPILCDTKPKWSRPPAVPMAMPLIVAVGVDVSDGVRVEQGGWGDANFEKFDGHGVGVFDLR